MAYAFKKPELVTPSEFLQSNKCLGWDVNNGVSRRAWSGNSNADITIRRAMQANPDLVVTLPNTVVNDDFIDKLI